MWYPQQCGVIPLAELLWLAATEQHVTDSAPADLIQLILFDRFVDSSAVR